MGFSGGGGGGGGLNIAARARSSLTPVFPQQCPCVPSFNIEDYNTVGATMHDLTKGAVALTGTVQKTAASGAVVGTGTHFTTEVAIGEQITIPGGGGNDVCYVLSITDDTHMTIVPNAGFSAAGQVATLDERGRFYAPQTAVYEMLMGVRADAATSAPRELDIWHSGTQSNIGLQNYSVPTSPVMQCGTVWKMNAGEFVVGSFQAANPAGNSNYIAGRYGFFAMHAVAAG